jgi:plasmid stabilization system protein ParE
VTAAPIWGDDEEAIFEGFGVTLWSRGEYTHVLDLPRPRGSEVQPHISRDNPVAAQRMGEELIKQSEAMAAFPQSGRMVPEKKDPLIRETLVGSYRIIYRADAIPSNSWRCVSVGSKFAFGRPAILRSYTRREYY